MTVLSTIKNIKSAMGLGQANFIPFVNLGTGTPRKTTPQVLGTQTSSQAPQSFYTPPQSIGGSYYNASPNAYGQLNYLNKPSGGTTQANLPSSDNQINTVNQNAGDQQAQADYEFEQAMNVLGEQEGLLRQEATVGESEQKTAGESAKLRAQEAQTAQLGGLAEEGQVGEKSASSGLKQARDLFRQIQQQNIAQLSGLGISSSSVTEALAEKLGVETASRIAGITGSLAEVRQNIAREKTRIGEVFQNKLTEIANNTQLAIDKIKLGLQQGLAQIAAERGKAAVAKAQARTDIMTNARNLIQQIQLAKQEKDYAVQQAAAKRTQALADAESFMFKPTDFTKMQQYIKNVQTLPQVAGFNPVPTFTPTEVYGQGYLQPGFSYEKANTEDENDIYQQLLNSSS